MRRLFDENDNWTDEARTLSIKFSVAVRPLIHGLIESGVSVRDIECILWYEVGTICSELKVRRDVQRRKRQLEEAQEK